MRFVALALIILSLPVLIALLRQNPHRRPWALTAIGTMLFLVGDIKVEASVIAWPVWQGLAKGMPVSLVDMIAVALLVTRRPSRHALPFWPLLIFFGATVALSVAMSAVPMASFFQCWQFCRALLLFAAIGGECARRDMRRALFVGFTFGLLYQASYVIQHKIGGAAQASGTLHQNMLGMLTCLAMLPMIGELFLGGRNKMIGFGVILALFIVAAGGSRAAMGFAVAELAVFMILSLVRQMTPAKMKIVGFGVIVSLFAIPLAAYSLQKRFGSAEITLSTDEVRIQMNNAAAAISADYPFGIGANMYVPTANMGGYSGRALSGWDSGTRSAPVHNAYLLARAELGWMGLLAFLLLLITPQLRAFRSAFQDRRTPTGEVALASAVALAINLIYNRYEFAVLTYNVMAFAIINLGLIAAHLNAVRAQARVGGRTSRPTSTLRRQGVAQPG